MAFEFSLHISLKPRGFSLLPVNNVMVFEKGRVNLNPPEKKNLLESVRIKTSKSF